MNILDPINNDNIFPTNQEIQRTYIDQIRQGKCNNRGSYISYEK